MRNFRNSSRPTMACLAGLVSSLLSISALAQVPERLNYQGYLTTNDGTPIHCPDAVTCTISYALTFRLYDALEGGPALFEETHEVTPIVQGVFNITLGSIEVLDPSVLSGSTFLGVEINGQAELLPRQEVVSAAYALRAEQAVLAEASIDSDQLGGLPAENYVTVDDVGSLVGPAGTQGEIGPPGPPGETGATGPAPDTNEFVSQAEFAALQASIAALEAAVTTGLGSVMYIDNGDPCPSGWTLFANNWESAGNCSSDICYRTDKQCLVFYIHYQKTCPSGFTQRNNNACTFGGSASDICYKCD